METTSEDLPAATATAAPRMTRALTWLFALAGGAAVGNLYYAQPVLDDIGSALHARPSVVGLLVTAAQVGYALGICFLVPLGDLRERRRLVPVLMLASAVALLACAAAPTFAVLVLALLVVGVTTVSGQVLTPLAGDLADDRTRGTVVGMVVSGLVSGVLVARVLAGVIADVAGWRAVFVVAAALVVVLAVLLHRAIPPLGRKVTGTSYRAALRSVAALVAHEPTLRVSMLIGGLGFAGFTMFWTALTFLLASPAYGYSTTVIGLFGVIGLAGAVAAQGAGRIHDRGWSVPGTGLAWLVVAVAWALAWFGGHALAPLVAGIVLLDAGSQGQNILNQARVFALSGPARSRLNTAYFTSNFVGGAVGSLGATVLWAAGGWDAVCAAGVGLAAAALVVWALARRGPLRVQAARSLPVVMR